MQYLLLNAESGIGISKVYKLLPTYIAMVYFTSKSTEENMGETKSRYEVIAELEDKKRRMIQERESFPDKIKQENRRIRDAERELADSKEELIEFEKTVEDRKKTIAELIKSIDDSLARFAELNKAK